jgi:starvation-inducible DNA-binding protein
VIRTDDILPPPKYELERARHRAEAMAARALRRIAIGPHASLVFENRTTVRYQVQEIVRAEHISDPAAVRQEIDAYAHLLPAPAELAASLFIEYPDPTERDRALSALTGIEQHLHLELRGERRTALFDPHQTDGRRISAVQFVRIPLQRADIDAFRSGAPMRVVLDHPNYSHHAVVPARLSTALAIDLDEAAAPPPSAAFPKARPAMYRSPSVLPEGARARLVDALNARLADGLDLHGQIKVAHWNVKGPLFPSLHPLFETFAVTLAAFNDEVAERAVTLGGLALGSARQVAARSTLPEAPADLTRDLELVGVLADRFEAYLVGAREARATASSLGDDDSVDLFTRIIQELEKQAWFLRASQA